MIDWEGETIGHWNNIIWVHKQFNSKEHVCISFIIIKIILEYNQVGESDGYLYVL